MKQEIILSNHDVETLKMIIEALINEFEDKNPGIYLSKFYQFIEDIEGLKDLNKLIK